MITINEYLEEILIKFKDGISGQNSLCDLTELNFQNGNIPEYSNVNVQRLYLLRYAYGYTYEYKVMYEKIFSENNFGEVINVTSIGCGAMLDYWSLMQVVGSNKKVTYNGIDQIDWSDKIIDKDIVTFNISDARLGITSSSDIYIFPKSISEILNFNNMFSSFKYKETVKDRFHILVSLRNDDTSLLYDMEKVQYIKNILVGMGYKVKGDPDGYYVNQSGRKIRELDGSFKHPNSVIDFLKALRDECKGSLFCDKCGDELNRWPILASTSARFSLLTFVKG